jgi:two-component system nitrogen regulation sensor histidine kinase GlnL
MQGSMTMPGHAAHKISAIDPAELLNALPHPVLAITSLGYVREANAAAETFFGMSKSAMQRRPFAELLPFGSPLLSLIEQVSGGRSTINEYRVDLGSPRLGTDRIVDIHAAPMHGSAQDVIIMLQERTIADKMDRQLTHRGAARSVSALASMLAHEIKNPLSGIRGAAQLLETGASDGDRMLTRLICDETDRIVKLVDRMEVFSDERPIDRESVNIHTVLSHVKQVAQAGFARHIRFTELYDPSLPPLYGNKDQLIQVFLNLVKNAAESIGLDSSEGEIELTTAFRSGVRIKTSTSRTPVGLPLEICVRDNGPGIPADLQSSMFDPFVTNKATGTGLGLALVAKIIGDHGGIVECESKARWTVFRVLLPMFSSTDGRMAAIS